MIRIQFMILFSSIVMAQDRNCTEYPASDYANNSSWHRYMIQNALDSAENPDQNTKELEEDLHKFIQDNVIYDGCIGQDDIDELFNTKFKGLQDEHNFLLHILIIVSSTTTLLSITAVFAVAYLHNRIKKLHPKSRLIDATEEKNSNGNSLQIDVLQAPQQEMTGSRINLTTNAC